MRWGRHQGYHRIFMGPTVDDLTTFDTDGMAFDEKVLQGMMRMPCLTTPAPTDQGRPAPKRSKGRMDEATRNRWVTGNRQFAPWHYAKEAMMTAADGTLHLPSISVKEQLHHMPKGFTAHGDVDDKSRHKMLGNSWHLGVARFILMFVLQWSGPSPTEAGGEHNTVDEMAQWARTHPVQLGPRQLTPAGFDLPWCNDMQEHFEASQAAIHPSLQDPALSPSLEQVVQRNIELSDRLSKIRLDVVTEIKDMVAAWEEKTHRWWTNLARHLQMVYLDPSSGYITQIPVFLALLEKCGFPGLTELQEDLNQGFPTVGDQHRGVGWLPRSDGRYSDPLPLDVFEVANRAYVHQKLKQGYVDEHWQEMLNELLDDRSQGRLEGPFRAPEDWPVPAAGIPGEPLLPAPTGRVCAAVCFAVCQSDKVRRCEDYRRSFHNATIRAHDVPHHDDISVYVQLSRWWRRHSTADIGVWAHDLDAAYRQLGVKDPSYAYVILQTPGGPLLFRHTALCFGSSASVWSFNRMADAMVYLTQSLLIAPCVHYVDDFGNVEPMQSAPSSFWAFSEMFRILGLKMKEKKAMPPSTSQRMLGVIMTIRSDTIELAACPARIEKLQGVISTSLESNQLAPEVAHRLAGKLLFLQTTCFGQMGKAAVQCIYSRAAQGSNDFNRLTGALEASLLTLRKILGEMGPQVIPCFPAYTQSVLYTDAFFQLGDILKTASNRMTWCRKQVTEMKNGWGFVMATEQEVFFSHGQVPANVLKHFNQRRAYIYFLEAIAPVIATVVMRNHCSKFLLVFIDNQASLQALRKGYGRDQNVNGLLSFFWSLVARMQIHIHFEWVPSELNIADPISRHSLEIAERHGWTEVDLDLAGLYKIINRCSHDLQYATQQAVDDCFSLQQAFRQSLVQGGIQSPRWLESGLSES